MIGVSQSHFIFFFMLLALIDVEVVYDGSYLPLEFLEHIQGIFLVKNLAKRHFYNFFALLRNNPYLNILIDWVITNGDCELLA